MTRKTVYSIGAVVALAIGTYIAVPYFLWQGSTDPRLYPRIAAPTEVTNEVLIKTRASARGTVRVGAATTAGFSSFASAGRVRGIGSVRRLVTPSPTSDLTAPIFDWYVVTFADSSTATVSTGRSRRRERDTRDRVRTRMAADLLRADTKIERVEMIGSMTADVLNDPYYGSSGAWGQTFADEWPLKLIHAEEAWATTMGAGVTVAVIDTGVDMTDPELAPNLWTAPDGTHGWNFVRDLSDPTDDFGHGHHAAGTIAAVGNNNAGIVGVAPAAKIMALKALDQNGAGDLDDLSAAIVWAKDHGAKVINASWGGGGLPPQVLIDAVAYAHDGGVVFVAAAGNSNADIGGETSPGFYPASLRNAISVAASDHNDVRAFFSNFGLAVDVTAPGGGDTDPSGIQDSYRSILSLLAAKASPTMTGNGAFIVGGKYLRQAGTSMAAPHVSGLAALILAQHPNYTPEQVRQTIRQSSDDVQASGVDLQSGYGRINAVRALAAPTPLNARLISPTIHTLLRGQASITVLGSASGAGMAQWRLDYSNGGGWTPIDVRSTPVDNGTLATWNTGAVADGTYTLRLTVTGASGTYYDQTDVTIDNVYLTSPLPLVAFTPFKAGERIDLLGTVAPAAFTKYTLRVLNADTGNYLTPPGLSLSNGGLQPIRDGVLATWDTTGVPGAHYTLELAVNGAVERTGVLIDPTLHVVLRQRVPVTFLYGGSTFYTPSTDHLTVVTWGGKRGLLLNDGRTVDVIDASGASWPGWPQAINPTQDVPMALQGPASGDLDGDGKPEIVVIAGTNIMAWHVDGSGVAGYPKYAGPCAHVAVDDLYGNGKAEVVCTWFTSAIVPKLVVIDPDMTVHQYAMPARADNLSIGDVDGDGQKDLIFRSQVDSIHTPIYIVVVSPLGVVKRNIMVPYVNTPTLNYWLQNVALGDLDGDGVLDIVTGDYDGRLLGYHGNGTPVTGFPLTLSVVRMNPAVPVLLNPVVVDLDGDGKNEVVVTLGAGYDTSGKVYDDIYVFKRATDGAWAVATGWPQSVVNPYGSVMHGMGELAIGDVDGDGKLDIVTSTDGVVANALGLTAFSGSGQIVPGFPKLTAALDQSTGNAPALFDLDGDGKLNAAWLDWDGNLYIWDLPSTNTAAPWPMFQRDAGHTGRPGAVVPVPPPPPPPPPVPVVVTWQVPAPGATLSGSTGVLFNVSGPVARATLAIDGVAIGNFMGAPFSYSWDTTKVADGSHTLLATAFDAASKSTSASVTVTVKNVVPPPPPPPPPSTTLPTQTVIVKGAWSDARVLANGEGVEISGASYSVSFTSGTTVYTVTVTSAGVLTVTKGTTVLKSSTITLTTALHVDWTSSTIRIRRGSSSLMTITGVPVAPTVSLQVTGTFAVVK